MTVVVLFLTTGSVIDVLANCIADLELGNTDIIICYNHGQKETRAFISWLVRGSALLSDWKEYP